MEQLLSGQIERSRGNRGSERERRERKVALVIIYRVSRVRVVRDNSARKIRIGNEIYTIFLLEASFSCKLELEGCSSE